MKKIVVILSVLSIICMLCACGKANSKSTPDNTSSDITIVTTIFPEYDWVKNILGDNPANIKVEMLLDSKVDLHSYQPTSKDIVKIKDADLFVYVGGESDDWVEKTFKSADITTKTVNLMEVLKDAVKEEEVVEGMQEEEHDHDHDEDADEEANVEEEHEHEEEYDEHVWLSLRNASKACEAIEAEIEKLDAINAETYKNNLSGYQRVLGQLDEDFKKVVKEAKRDTIICADRFPFRYLVDDYGLKYYAAFVGCSAETEASFETVIFLANKSDELDVPAIFVIDGSDMKIAKTVIENSSSGISTILTLDSLQSTTLEDYENGKTYVAVMSETLKF